MHYSRNYEIPVTEAADMVLSSLATADGELKTSTRGRGFRSNQVSAPPRDFADYGPLADPPSENGSDGRYPEDYME